MDRNSGSKRRGTTSAVMTFMNSIKNELGDSAYDTLLGVNGEVTLMLALDNTGSMGGTIEAAKDIATSIINHPRKEKVDVILSPFNDPGIVSFKNKDDNIFNFFRAFIKRFLFYFSKRHDSPMLY